MDNDFVYILYPISKDKLKGLGIGLVSEAEVKIPLEHEEDFVPLWYGNAKFPEDE